ncbi:MAG: copper-binding protein [Desulfarculaceae bacterium]|nr:copper-binding protein [Desulfarculaceae bacterium]MCF8072808.1 copper-binding protein [Desulfarculaceae bacterium]MCF8100976.1 copper-binding protein [Desulfarculaceae bacterium]MCF8118540.1 copper-binding protein [Desulfarculaceae bacterium]
MKRLILVALAVALVLGAAPLALAADSGIVGGVVAVDVLQLSGTVTALDLKARTVTIKGDGGRTIQLNAKQARNLEQVKVGDRVVADFIESVALYVTKPEGAPAAGVARMVKLAPKGQMPGGLVAEVVEMRAQVVAIDYKARTVSLKGPEGAVRTLKIGPEAKNFDKVKKGDDVVLRVSEAFALTVKRP